MEMDTETLPEVAAGADAGVAPYVADHAAFERELPAGEPAALRALRRRAIERFAGLGFPTPRWEEWRSTNVAPISRTAFARAGAAGAPDLPEAAVAPWTFPRAAARLVFVDGRFAPRLSEVDERGLPAGTFVGSLAEALARAPGPVKESVEHHLGRHAGFERQPFTALNTAFFHDGGLVWLPRGAVLGAPIHLLFLAGPGNGQPTVSYPRNLIVLGEGSQATLVETYGGPGGVYWTCPVTELVAGPGAVLDHYKVQREGREAFHTATFQLHQDRSTGTSSHSISIGGALVRNDVNAVLDGEGGDCVLNGLYLVEGRQHVDNHMRVEHAKPHCSSHELYKGILDGKGRAVFNGLIYVHKGAQKTDAKQSNRNLLLSREAVANSNPQLEIFADDVRCTHGSTVGQLDEDAVFYLRSRGIGREAARSLLTYAFASDIVERIRVEPVRHDLEEFLFARLPKGEVVRQAV